MTTFSARRTWAGARAVRATGCLLAAFVMVPKTPATAAETDSGISLAGSARTIAAGTDNYRDPAVFGEHEADGVSQTILRLIMNGRPLDWLSFEVHGVQTVTFDSYDAGLASVSDLPGLGGNRSRYRANDVSWKWLERDHALAELYLDRANVQVSASGADFTVGRQAINFGKAYFWNPLDLFLPFDPRQFDREYKAGVDAARLDVPLGAFSGINVVGVAGRELPDGSVTWRGAAMIGRTFGNCRDWDWAIQGGKIAGGAMAGAGVSGEVGGIAIRGEAARTFADDAETDEPELAIDGLTAVAGVGHRFENTLDIEAEYFYNEAGAPADLTMAALRVANGSSLQMSHHLAGIVGRYELTPLVKTSLAWIYSISDTSSLFQPGVQISTSNESELLVGGLVSVGDRPDSLEPRSEFGIYPTTVYLEFKYYF